MGKIDKLIERLLSYPKDFTWEELKKILAHFGYDEIKKGKTGGSRRKFADKENNIICLHEPHPAKILKDYAVKEVVNHLKEKGKLK
jgi:hypothetical protein